MSIDLTLLRLCRSRTKYERLAGEKLQGLDATTQTVLDTIGAYWREFPDAKELDLPTFKPWAASFKLKNLGDEDHQLALACIDKMDHPVPPELEAGMTSRIVSMGTAAKLLTTIVAWNEGQEVDLLLSCQSIVDDANDKLERKTKHPLVQQSPEELMKMDVDQTGITFRLKCLRDSFRPMREGDFGIYAMRPDAGKTTFLTSESSHWITQLDKVWPGENRVGVWLNNEGPGSRIKQRWYQSVLGATVPEMVAWAEDGSLSKRIEEKMGCGLDRMLFFDIHDFTSAEVEQIIKSLNPGFVIFDMIDNINFVGMGNNGGTRTDQLLEAMYSKARTWCTKYGFIGWATSQVSAEGEDVPYPPQSALKDSKTGKQGACDFIIIGGKKNDLGFENVRFMGAPKNKLHRPGGSKDPHTEVMMDAERARFYDAEVM